jgi:DNA-binding transcriptional regulator YhcF (GntR family)
MRFYRYLVETYGYDEPIFTDQVKEELNINPNTLRQQFKRLADTGQIEKVQNGLYFIPKKKPLFGSPVLNVERIIERKFLKQQKNVEGYIAGTNFANRLGLTSQTAAMATVVTNHTSSVQRVVTFYNNKVIIKKPRVRITNENYKLLQVLDLLNEYERYSEKALSEGISTIKDYLNGVYLEEEELKTYLNAYPVKTKLKVYESGLFDAITRRQGVVQ